MDPVVAYCEYRTERRAVRDALLRAYNTLTQQVAQHPRREAIRFVSSLRDEEDATCVLRLEALLPVHDT